MGTRGTPNPLCQGVEMPSHGVPDSSETFHILSTAQAAGLPKGHDQRMTAPGSG